MNWTYFDPKFESEPVLNDLDSAWAGHRYFAYDLLTNIKPKTVVELGTHWGTSFFAFCQAVKDNNLECDLFAVDSWKGDPHASFYGGEVYESVQKITSKYYSCLDIHLLRMNFDDAIEKFADNSIDLLHIDGYHTYAAVRHDFEAWIGKVSANGVILFHDTSEKKDDFGVFRFWDQIKKKFNNIEFFHSHGLGVLFKDPYAQDSLILFKDIWARYYSLYHENKKIGNNISQYISANETLNNNLHSSGQEIENLNTNIERKDNELISLHSLLAQKDNIILQGGNLLQEKERILQHFNNIILENETLIKATDHVLSEQNQTIRQQDNCIQDKVNLITELNSSILEKERLLEAAQNSIQDKDNLINTLQQNLRVASQIVEHKEQYIFSLYNSFSWKITRPFRWLHPKFFSFFYFFCPYGSKRWLIVKTLFRILANPGYYFKLISRKNISNYFRILSGSNLVNYNQRIENFNSSTLDSPPAKQSKVVAYTSENKLIIPEFSDPVVLFCYGMYDGEKELFDSICSIIRYAQVPFRITVLNSKHLAFSSIQNIAALSSNEIHPYLTKHASIKYICLLDSTTLIQPDTISFCSTTLDRDDTFSMVVPKVISNASSLRSAGSILWNNGSYSLVGNGEDPNNPEFLYLRETDSGDHFAMIRKEVFSQWISNQPISFISWPYSLHDISMFIRKSYAKVMYQPQAIVSTNHPSLAEIQPEFVSLFYDKWKHQLLNDHFSDNVGNYFFARERGMGKQYMLMIDHYVPTFDKDAGSRTMKHYMELFVDHDIILKFIGDNFYPEEKYVTYFQQKGIEILYGGYCENNWYQWLKKYGNIFNYVFLSRPTIAIKYIDVIKEFTRAKIFFYGHDLHYLREFRQYQLEQKEELLKTSQDSKEMEGRLFESVDFVYYPSQAEIDIIEEEFKIKGKVRKIVPYVFDNFQKPDYLFNERKDIMFVGGFLHKPNSDAILWFLEEIFPHIIKYIPEIKLFIAGSNPTEEIKSKATNSVIVTGFLSDEELRQLYLTCRLVVAPLRYGAGLKGKIVEALYYGVPVITTSIGFEGLDGAESIITIADKAEDFVQSVLRLYSNEKELLARSAGSFEYVKENFSKDKAYSIIQQDLDQGQHFFDNKISPTIKILFVSHDANLGGAQLLFISMLRWLKAHTAIDIRILCNDGGILIHKFREIATTMVFSELESKHHLKKDKVSEIISFCNGKPDLIYGNSIAAGRSYSTLESLNVPVITHVHELQMSIQHYASGFIDDVLRLTTFYIAGSNAVSENLIKGLGIFHEKIKVIYDFIEENELPQISTSEKNNLRRKLGLYENKFLVFGCGVGLFWRKGIDLFVEIARNVRDTGPDDIHFYWIGSTEETDNHPKSGTWDAIFKKIKDYDLSDHITFLGIKSDFKEYFKAGNVFLLSSREDPFPLVCLEAAQLGLPVICFEKAGGMPEFVEQDAGFIVPFEDTKSAAAKIRILSDQKELCCSLGQNARKKVLSRHTVGVNLPMVLSKCRDISGQKPMVSIIVPNYNYGRFLEKRLSSILNQTFKDYEIIILDDASDDNSLEIIKQFSENHHVEVLINSENSGSVFKQWYKGVKIARAEVIWIAESDDFSDPRFLEKMLPLMNDKEINLAYCASHVIDDEEKITEHYYQLTGYYNNLPGGNKWKKNYICSGDTEINDGLGIINIIPNASAALIRRSSLLSINTDELYSYRCAGDWFIYLNIIRSGKIAYLSTPLNYHRRHKQSVVGRSVNKAEETIPDYFKIHQFVIRNFHITDVTFEKQTGYVLNELRHLWPDLNDNKYFKLYNTKELKQCFDQMKSHK